MKRTSGDSMIIYFGIREKKFCVTYSQNRAWPIKLHIYFLRQQKYSLNLFKAKIYVGAFVFSDCF